MLPEIATIGFATKAASLPQATLHYLTGRRKYFLWYWIHGEEGHRIVPFQSSEILSNEIISKLRLHYHWKKRVINLYCLVNNLGTTSNLEMGIFINDILQLLEIEGVTITFIKSGTFMTSLDMAGISVTLCPVKM